MLSVILSCVSAREARAAEDGKPEKMPEAIKTADDFERWATYYYLDPKPEMTVEAIAFIAKEGAIGEHSAAMMGFLAEVFRQNKGKLQEWTQKLDALEGKASILVWTTLWLSDTAEAKEILKKALAGAGGEEEKMLLGALMGQAPPEAATMEIGEPAVIDMLWGTFFATGDKKYVLRIAGVLPWGGQKEDLEKAAIAAAAKWSLVSNAVRHDLVMKICKEEIQRQPGELSAALKAIVEEAARTPRDGQPAPAKP